MKGNLTKDMFIDNPRDNSFTHANEKNNAISVVQIQEVQQDLRDDKNKIVDEVAAKVATLNIDKSDLSLSFSGQLDKPFTVTIVIDEKTFIVESNSKMIASEQSAVTSDAIAKRFKSFKNSRYNVAEFDFSQLADSLTIPFKELTDVKNKVAYYLNGEKDVISAVTLPAVNVAS